jgi:hypothetical protein
MQSIIAIGPADDDPHKNVDLFKWDEYLHDENRCETYDNVLQYSLELLKDYYGKNPTVERAGRYETKRS